MKRFFVFAFYATAALNSFAYYGDYSYSSSKIEMPGWLTFMVLIMIAWGILEIILFFKIWGMTNDIRELKDEYFNEKKRMRNNLRKNYFLGDMEMIKKTLLEQFIDEIEAAFSQMKSYGYEEDAHGGTYHTVSYKEKNLNESIRMYVDKLQKQFDIIGEEIPLYIKQMETFRDYYSIFAGEEQVDSKVEPSTEEGTVVPIANPTNNTSSERSVKGNEQTTEKKAMSNYNLYFVTIPIIASFAFLVGVAIFHANYSYTDWWVEESSILIPVFIVFAIVIGIYYVIVWNKKKSS